MTIVEYVLIISTVTIGSISGIGAIDSAIGSNYESTANDIGQAGIWISDVTTTPSGGDVSVECKDKTFKDHHKRTAMVRLRLKDSNKHDLKDASVVAIFTLHSGTTQQVSGTTNSHGEVELYWTDLEKSDFKVTVTVLSVTKGGVSYSPPSKTCSLKAD